MQDIHPVDRCPECDYPWTGLPPEGRCPECGFPYDSHTTVHRLPKTIAHLCMGLLVMGLLGNVHHCYRYVNRPGFVEAPPGSLTPLVKAMRWDMALEYGCGAVFCAALLVWVCLLARGPWYVSFDSLGMRVRWGGRTRTAEWRGIKEIDTSRRVFDYIVPSHGRRIRVIRSPHTKTYKQFLTRADEQLIR
ncbi:MAG: hypothetical protein JXB13_08795 [Phycisphaerae bacterium]|nr:hypothetical protein [Phycisphaerae bacterium]